MDKKANESEEQLNTELNNENEYSDEIHQSEFEDSLDDRVNLVLINQESSVEKEYQELLTISSERRVASRLDQNSPLMADALKISNAYERVQEAPNKTGMLTVMGGVAKTFIKPFIKEKPKDKYIESHAGLSEQVHELSKRMGIAIDEINSDVQNLIGVKNRMSAVLERAGAEIEDIKDLMSETGIEITALDGFVAENKHTELPEIHQAESRSKSLRHTITRLDRRLLNKQSEFAHMLVQLNTVDEDIDAILDQSENLKSTRRGLLQLLESASISYAEDKTMERARMNSRIQTGINQAITSFHEKSALHAEQIARQAERPVYGITMLERSSELRESIMETRRKTSEQAAIQRETTRQKLAQIVKKEGGASSNMRLASQENKMLIGRDSSKKDAN